MDIFCPKHVNCEAPISVIAEILSNNSSERSLEIEKEFKILGFNKVKDLAKSTLGKACTMPLDDDPLAKLYEAIEIYDTQCANQLVNAKSEYKQGNCTKSLEICKNMILSQPNDLNVILLFAASYFGCKEYDKSLEILNKAFTKHSGCCELLFNIGTIYWKKSEFKKAMDCYHDALCLKPGFHEGWIYYAAALVESNDIYKAECAYKSILKQNPKLYIARNMYGRLLLSLNKIKEAKQQFKIAKEDAPEFVDIWNNLGDVYYLNIKIKKAILHYENALKIDPNLSATWINLGVAYFKLKEYSNALHSFQKALELSPNNISALKNLAIVYDNQDNLPLAIESYKQLLEHQPNNSDVHFLLGVKLFQCLNYQEAEIHFKKCIELNPQKENVYMYLCSVNKLQGKIICASENCIALGDLYFNQNNNKKAIEAYGSALYLDPKNGKVHWKLGLSLHKIGCLDEAYKRYRACIELKPTFPDVYCDTALICETKDEPQKAIDYYKLALFIQPDHINTLFNISNLLLKLGNLDEAIKFYKEILKYDKSLAFDVHLKLANIYYNKMENLNEALFHFKKSLLIDNSYVDGYLNMGNILLKLRRSQEALNCFNLAVQVDSQCVIAYTNIGSIHKNNENFNEAIQAYKTALSIEPEFPDAYCNLVQCLQHICEWSNYNDRIAKLNEIVCKQLDNDQIPSLMPHHSLLYPFSAKTLKQLASKHADKCVKKINLTEKSFQNYKYQTTLSPINRIRVGYVSSDFGDHPTSQLMQSIPNFHNRNNIEVFSYSLTPNDSSPSWLKISTESDHLRDISDMNAIDAANLINEDGIHILINMNGFTKGARNEIFALRPAPIQVLWLGYPGTSGATFIDYLITDKVCSPPELKHYYTEELAYMKRSVYIGDHKQMFSDLQQRVNAKQIVGTNTNNIDTLPMNNGNGNIYDDNTNDVHSIDVDDNSLQCFTRKFYNLPEDAIVYCNFGQLYKIDPSTFKMWSTILLNVPNSVLWLLRFPDAAEHNLRKSAAALNIDSSRIIFSNLEPIDKHMRRIQLADIFLDTPLCNGHTTCLDALWAGIPVITLPGETFASRVAASQLSTLGHTFTVALNEKDYIEIATKLGLNSNLLETLESTIWSLKMNGKLFDCKSYAEELETVYKDLWEKFLSKTQLNP